jgi:hypothetical protein
MAAAHRLPLLSHLGANSRLLLLLTACITATTEAAEEWQCDPPPGQNCQRRLGPQPGQSYEEWESELQAWVATGRDFFDFSAYDNPDIQWAQT